MKKLFFLLMCVLGMHSARAQLTDIWLDDGVILSNDQWHYNDFSIIATNRNTFLVITPESYFYRQVPPYRKPYFPRLYQDVVLNYYPYFYRGRIGWYVHGRRYNYFYNGIDDYVILNLAPVMLDFWLDLRQMRHLDLRHWHFYDRPPVYRPKKHRYMAEHSRLKTNRRSVSTRSYAKRSTETRPLSQLNVPENHPPKQTQVRPDQNQRSYRSEIGQNLGSRQSSSRSVTQQSTVSRQSSSRSVSRSSSVSSVSRSSAACAVSRSSSANRQSTSRKR